MTRLNGKTAVITGGATGIGLASSDSSFMTASEVAVDGVLAQL